MTSIQDTIKNAPWAEKAKEIAGDPVNLVRFLARLMADERVPRAAKLKVVAAGLYTWVDGDLVPDPIKMVPGLGYVDDIILVIHGVKCLVAETEPPVAAELWPGDEASFKRCLTAVAWVDEQLYGRVRIWVNKALGALLGQPKATPNR
jgi:uncharacterized membrane protein YkvA (DUF1232 family)